MKLRCACVQFAPAKGRTDANLDAVADHAAQAISEAAELIVFPETATSGYFVEGAAAQVALDSKELHGRLSSRIQRWPEETAIVVGHYERSPDGEIYNAATLMRRGGPVATHRKLFLPTYGVFDEERFISRGERLTMAAVGDVPASLFICEDIWHSITPTLAALAGAAILIVPSASPARGFEGTAAANHTTYRAICEGISGEHGLFVINAQLVGYEGGKGFVGGSVITDPFGATIAAGPIGEEAILLSDLDLDLIGIARANSPLLSDLRTMWPRLLKIASQIA